jgi:hypothetical protein
MGYRAMKMFRFAALLVAILAAAPAAAQWATPNHSVPIGRGLGVIGQGSAGPGTLNLPLLGQGASADPVFAQVPNGGIAPGAIDTVKGSIDGVNASDMALLNCANQFLTYSTATHLFSCGITGALQTANSALSFGFPVNLQLNATVGGSALTIAVKGNNGTDPSATNPVLIPFRDVTLTSGDPVIRSLTAALSFTIASTNTMGCLNATNCRLWVMAIDNGGTVALCASNQLSFDGTAGHAANIQPLYEDALKTSASGTSGGSSAQTIYCSTSAVTNKVIRILGYVEIQEATAGTWTTAPTLVQLFGPSQRRPGETLQMLQAAVGTTSQAITPFSSANPVLFSMSCAISSNFLPGFASSNFTRGATTLITQSIGDNSAGAGTFAGTVAATFLDVPATNSSVTYAVSGCSSNTSVLIQEIMGAVEPVNDNGLLEMAG